MSQPVRKRVTNDQPNHSPFIILNLVSLPKLLMETMAGVFPLAEFRKASVIGGDDSPRLTRGLTMPRSRHQKQRGNRRWSIWHRC